MTRGLIVKCAGTCNRMIDSGRPGVFLAVSGWAENRDGGGAHSITLRKDTGAAMCSSCMDVLKLGAEQLDMEAHIT